MTRTKHQHGVLELSILQVGAFASIPPIMAGYILATRYGVYTSILNIILGNFIVFLLSMPIGIQASKDKKTSAMQVKDTLGKQGNKITILGLLILLIGWFALNINLIGEAILDITNTYLSHNVRSLSPLFNIIIGSCIIYIVSRGITVLKNLTKVFVILFFATIALNLFTQLALNTTKLVDYGSYSIAIPALVFVVACPIGQIFDLPTFHRFAISIRSSIISNALVFLFFLPLVEITGSLLYIHSNSSNIISSLINQNLPIYLLIWNAVFITISVCSIDNINLYVLAVNTEVLMPRISFKYRAYIIGVVAVLFSLTNVANNFISLLNNIVVIIASILSLLIIRAFSSSPFNTKISNIALLIGIVAGLLNNIILPSYNFPYVSASIVTVFFYLILYFLNRKKVSSKV